jgi:hypothetical protein
MNRYLFLFLLLISCSVKDCHVGPNAIVQQKIETRTNTDSKTIDSKSDIKNIVEQIRDFKDTLQPGAQLKCNF